MDNRTELETRNILDSDGNIIVAVSLPAGTIEEQWQSALNGYIIANTSDDTQSVSEDEGILPVKKVTKTSTRTKLKKQ